MDDFDDNILLGNFALEIPSMDELIDIPTQQLIKPEHELLRYGKPLSDKEMDLEIRSRIPKNTNKANEWAIKVYEECASFRRDQMDTLLSDVTLPLHFTDGTNCELNYWLSKFIMEIRRQDGTDYPPNPSLTLYQESNANFVKMVVM